VAVIDGSHIVVTHHVRAFPTKASDVIGVVNDDPVASALVIASPPFGSEDTSGEIEDMPETPLTGGNESGIRLTEDSTGNKLLVDCCTHDDVENE
jgi:hypothetical protein